MLSRLMWVKVKFGRDLWVYVCAYGPSSERMKLIERPIENICMTAEFWKECEYCLVRRCKYLC